MFNNLSGPTCMVGAESVFWLLDPKHPHVKVKGRKAGISKYFVGEALLLGDVEPQFLVQAHYFIHFHRSRSIRNIPVSLPNLHCLGGLA